jgi:hypothetical protein
MDVLTDLFPASAQVGGCAATNQRWRLTLQNFWNIVSITTQIPERFLESTARQQLAFQAVIRLLEQQTR